MVPHVILLHESRMEDTNVEEESFSSEVAVSGLVALCNRVNKVNQISEFTEKNCQIVAAEVVGDSSVRIFIRNIASASCDKEKEKGLSNVNEDINSTAEITSYLDEDDRITQVYLDNHQGIKITPVNEEEIQWEVKVEESEEMLLENNQDDDQNNVQSVEMSIDIEDENRIKHISHNKGVFNF